MEKLLNVSRVLEPCFVGVTNKELGVGMVKIEGVWLSIDEGKLSAETIEALELRKDVAREWAALSAAQKRYARVKRQQGEHFKRHPETYIEELDGVIVSD